MSTIHKIKHEARGRDANKAQGEAECFTSIKSVHRVLYFMHKPCFNCFEELTHECLVKA